MKIPVGIKGDTSGSHGVHVVFMSIRTKFLYIWYDYGYHEEYVTAIQRVFDFLNQE